MIIKPNVFLSCRRRSCLSSLLIRSFSNNDGENNENVKKIIIKKKEKEIVLLRKSTTLHVHHAFWLLHDYDVKKCLMSPFMEDIKKRRRIFLSLSKLDSANKEINSR